ncbi:MAG: U32 family peptidase, partial [Clostridia bacterium]
LAREMTKKEICDVIKCDIETEMFIHGAMCVCQSGGCLMSSFIGKRSGNRGECAYPCRMEYKGTNPFPLSLKDMSLAAHIPEITGLFPDALKLEGRMKSPEYVYEMTLLYRKLLDQNRAASKLEIEHMANVFSRSGFTDGYFTGMRNETMFGIRSEEDKKKTREIDTKIEKSALKTNIYAEFSTGNKSKITLIHDDFYAYAEGATVLQAHSSPLEKSDLITRLSKLGGTPFCVGEIDVSVSENAYLPITEINNLRREGIKILSDMISSSRTRTEGITPSFVPKIAENSAKSGLVLRFDGDFLNLELLQYAARIEIPICNDHVWLSLSEKYAEKLCLVLPKTIYSGDAEKIKSLLRSAKKHEILMISIPNITFLPLVEGFSLYGDFSLNITNQNSCLLMQKLGFSQVTVSPEVSPRGFNDIGYIVYGKIPIMHTRNCIIKNISSCKNGLCREKLTDRTSAEFLIYGDFQCTNTIYNSVPIYLLDKPISNIKNPILLFTDENEAEQLNIYAAFCNNSAPDIRFTRGYY